MHMHILKKELTGLRVTVLFCFVGLLVQSRPHEGGHVQIIQILIKYTGCTYSKCSTGKFLQDSNPLKFQYSSIPKVFLNN
jgi:hypothetical protein